MNLLRIVSILTLVGVLCAVSGTVLSQEGDTIELDLAGLLQGDVNAATSLQEAGLSDAEIEDLVREIHARLSAGDTQHNTGVMQSERTYRYPVNCGLDQTAWMFHIVGPALYEVRHRFRDGASLWLGAGACGATLGCGYMSFAQRDDTWPMNFYVTTSSWSNKLWDGCTG